MTAKGRNGLLWGIGAFFFPWIILIVFMIPQKVPKLSGHLRNHPDFVGRNPIVASIMALSAIVAKADGHVSKEEIQLVKTFVIRRYRLSNEDLSHYEGAFNYGKEHAEDYGYFTSVIKAYRRYDLTMALSYLLMNMAVHDKEYDREEERIVRNILFGLGLGEYEYQSIKRYFTMGSQQYSYSSGYGGFNQQTQSQDLTKKYCDVLGVSETADMTEIKRAYRKLAKEHHPDKMASEGMPDDYIIYANQRISEINEAYEYLKKLKERS